MSEAASAGAIPIACPFCDAEARPGAKYCWLCGAKMEAAQPALSARADIVILPEEVGNWQPASATKSPKPAPFQFGISTLLVILTLAAVLLGVWKMAPGLGAVLTVVAALGLIGLAGVSSAEAKRQSQTAEMRREIQRAGVSRAPANRAGPLTKGEKAAAFMRPVAITLASVWIVISTIAVVALVMVVVAIIGILQTCSAMCSPPPPNRSTWQQQGRPVPVASGAVQPNRRGGVPR